MGKENAAQTKRRHHYVPVAYLKAFAAEDGMLTVYRKDKPDKPFRSTPGSTAFEDYYYAQPLLEGGRDTNTLEDRFSDLESKWPAIVQRLAASESVNDSLEDIFCFLALQRARVPAARDAAEFLLAEAVMATTRKLKAEGKLPPMPEGLENILDHVQVAIDPHQSIHAMIHIIKAMGLVFDRIGLVAVHNRTDVDFLTSDNPVMYFNPSVSNEELRPYALEPQGEVMLMMPVSPKLMIAGASWDKSRFSANGLEYSELQDANDVSLVNEKIVRFSYSAIYARSTPDEKLIRSHAKSSPVVLAKPFVKDGQHGVAFENIFGERRSKPKWKR
ncbi:DUF4238 domain-containing protein [Hyphomicrobium sp.]|uniref:DUF4238 domain-containing protein n=1 Tax=Hyphomicrobium sp. TaxID=82 RepID=UPI002FE1F7E9